MIIYSFRGLSLRKPSRFVEYLLCPFIPGIHTAEPECIVYNLCDNAIKYNRQHGSVIVTVENQADSVILSSLIRVLVSHPNTRGASSSVFIG